MATTMIISPTYGEIYFDAMFKAQHDFTVVATEHPVQSGVSITDHAFVEPEKVSLSIGISDAMGETEGHSRDAFKQLRDLLKSREPVTLVTRFQSYDDMLLISMSVPDEFTSMNGFKAELIFQHIEIVTAQVVSVQATVKSSKSTDTFKSTTEEPEVEELEEGSGGYHITQIVDATYSWLGLDGSKAGTSLVQMDPIDTSKYDVAPWVVRKVLGM